MIPGFSPPNLPSRPAIRPLEPDAPAWVHDLLQGAERDRGLDLRQYPMIEVKRCDPFVRVTARVPDATHLTADDLSRRVSEQYVAIDSLLSTLQRQPIRFWNYVPGIVETVEPGLDRYMAFNRGRYAALAESQRNGEPFERAIPTASAVGINGPDLIIDSLASISGGKPVNNPRQIPSWQYSRRYGPRPPCFARGTVAVLRGRPMLLVGGTASIVGEESRHDGDVRAQVDEALRNIEAVIIGAGGPCLNPLERLTDARIHVVHGTDAELVETLIRARGARTLRIETVLARVCRPELLVEIEGLADVRRGQTPASVTLPVATT